MECILRLDRDQHQWEQGEGGLILSYDAVDQIPGVPGFAEGWGRSIVPCPYCDGFGVAGQPWGLVWSGRSR
ncbi:thioredoxin reductase [Sphingobium xanthum]|uniref:hypothetical protein n=1 Tax=Sphingobium xanthum TaxID=1387165 RepID=UPI001C8C2152|nr:hypothetical protein [Sphingobium xanthum]